MSSVTCNQTNTQHLFPTTITTATQMMKYSHIQPHPIAEDGKTRKVSAQRPAPYTPETTQSVLRRNARERNRVKQVNNSFSRLRQHIPQSIIGDLTKGGGRGPQKKISKVDTLRIAVEYIRRLQDLLDDLNGGSSTTQQYESQNTGNCDSASNSSFASSTCSSTSYNTIATPNYYTKATSPLPASMEANIQQTHVNNSYNTSTTLLSPVSLNSYSPPHQATQLETNGCQSPTSSFNSSLSFDSGTFEQQQPNTATPQELSPHHYHHQQHQQQQQQQQQLHQDMNQTAVAHFDGNLQLKFEPYDNFNLDEEDCTPDDEEILDYISLWQEQ